MTIDELKNTDTVCFKSITIREYAVQPDSDDLLYLHITPCEIPYGKEIINGEICNKVNQLVGKHIDTINDLKDIPIESYKGGIQQELSIDFGDDIILLVGNTPNEEMHESYQEFKENVLNCIRGKNGN